MVKNILIGRYIPKDTLIHKLDPRSKIMIVLGFLLGIFFVKGYAGYAAVSGFCLMVAFMSQIQLKILLKSLRPVVFIILITFLLHLFITEGDLLFQVGPFTATYQGLARGMQMAWRLVLLILLSSFLTLTTSPVALTDGLERLLSVGKPIGVPAYDIAMMMTIALRFIPTLLDETERIIKAQKARGAVFDEGNVFSRIKALTTILVPLFLGAFRRADQLALAMEARCYRGGDGRTRMNEIQMKPVDYAALVLSGSFLLVVIAII